MSLLEKRRKERDALLLKNPLYTKKYKQSYITGMSALNIPYKGVQCDWHQIDTLKQGKSKGFITHPNIIIGTEDIFGEYGIWDCSTWLKERGFDNNTYLCATPIRAILDILYHYIVIKNAYPIPLDDFWDFMFDELDRNELKSKLDKLESILNHTEQQNIFKKWRVKNEL